MMNENLAKEISKLLFRQTKELNNFLGQARLHESEEDFKATRDIIGKCMGHIYFDGIAPLIAEYPHLKPKALD